MTLTVSASSLGALSRCGELYRRRYLDRERTPPASAMLVGRAVDFAVESSLGSRIEGEGPLPLAEVRSVAADSLRYEWSVDPPVLDEQEAEAGADHARGAAIDKAVRLAELHWKQVAPHIDPADVSRGFEIPILGTEGWVEARLIGYLDVQERDGTVRDTKTARKSPAAGAADRSLQLTVYAMAVEALDGDLPPRVVLDFLVDLKTPKAVTQVSARAPSDFEPLMARVGALLEVHRAGAFAPADPNDWWCSERFCPYWQTCRFARRPVSVATVAPEPITETLTRSLHDDGEQPHPSPAT